MINRLYQVIKYSPFFLTASAVFFNLGDWLAGLWGLPALIITLAYLIAVPILTVGIHFLFRKLKLIISGIPNKQHLTLIIFSLAPAVILSLAFPRQIDTSFKITPEASVNAQILLLETKADGHIIAVGANAADYGWMVEDGGIRADVDSRPLLVKIETRAGAPVSLLFRAGPKGGSAVVRYNHRSYRVDLKSDSPGEALLNFRTDFRGVPNWLFMPVVYGADIIAYFIYFYILFLLQERGVQTMNKKPEGERFLSHRAGLAILVLLSAVLHMLNALSVPLIFGADSPSFIRGAFHLVEESNFGGVSQIRGPGTTLLFAPAAALFGRNPWGVKILLHALALTLVPLSYRIGWQLSGRRWVAFLAGLAAALMPDLYFFSNFLMSDLPNLVIVSAFATLLISGLQTGKKGSIIGTLLTASFGALLRSENLALLALGAFVLGVQPAWNWLTGEEKAGAGRKIARRVITVGLALLVALLPVLWWSWHNYRDYGVFGMGNYAGEVFYTGWIYYAEGSGYPFTDHSSPAVQAIQAAVEEYPIQRMNDAGVPTGWNLYPSLIKAGYAPSQAFDLMTQAAWDSICANPRMAREVLAVKLKDGLMPVPTQMKTFPLPGEPALAEALKAQFFDSETLRLPGVIRLQRSIYTFLEFFYAHGYPLLVWLGLLAVYFSLLRKPLIIWWSLAAIALTRIFIPDIMGKADWRYTLSGMVLVQVVTVVWLSAVFAGIKYLFSRNPSASTGSTNDGESRLG